MATNMQGQDNDRYHFGETSSNTVFHAWSSAGAAGGTSPQVVTEAQSAVLKRVYIRVFTYMGLGVLLSFLIGIVLSQTLFRSAMSASGNAAGLVSLRMFLILAPIAQIALVLILSRMLYRMRNGAARICFFLYALSFGVTLSLYFSYYSLGSVIYAMLAAALVFGGMAFWGSATKRDLTPLGVAGRMLLMGVLLLSLVNLVLYFVAPAFADGLSMLVSYLVLAIFVGLTAYDMQKIKERALRLSADAGNGEAVWVENLAIQGALELYMDFINLFIRILLIFGNRRR